eukprot:scaffold2020_cov107-Isochrysis_galbana.AAC.3
MKPSGTASSRQVSMCKSASRATDSPKGDESTRSNGTRLTRGELGSACGVLAAPKWALRGVRAEPGELPACETGEWGSTGGNASLRREGEAEATRSGLRDREEGGGGVHHSGAGAAPTRLKIAPPHPRARWRRLAMPRGGGERGTRQGYRPSPRSPKAHPLSASSLKAATPSAAHGRMSSTLRAETEAARCEPRSNSPSRSSSPATPTGATGASMAARAARAASSSSHVHGCSPRHVDRSVVTLGGYGGAASPGGAGTGTHLPARWFWTSADDSHSGPAAPSASGWVARASASGSGRGLACTAEASRQPPSSPSSSASSTKATLHSSRRTAVCTGGGPAGHPAAASAAGRHDGGGSPRVELESSIRSIGVSPGGLRAPPPPGCEQGASSSLNGVERQPSAAGSSTWKLPKVSCTALPRRRWESRKSTPPPSGPSVSRASSRNGGVAVAADGSGTLAVTLAGLSRTSLAADDESDITTYGSCTSSCNRAGSSVQRRRIVLQVVGDGKQLTGAGVENGSRDAARVGGQTLPRLECLDRSQPGRVDWRGQGVGRYRHSAPARGHRRMPQPCTERSQPGGRRRRRATGLAAGAARAQQLCVGEQVSRVRDGVGSSTGGRRGQRLGGGGLWGLWGLWGLCRLCGLRCGGCGVACDECVELPRRHQLCAPPRVDCIGRGGVDCTIFRQEIRQPVQRALSLGAQSETERRRAVQLDAYSARAHQVGPVLCGHADLQARRDGGIRGLAEGGRTHTPHPAQPALPPARRPAPRVRLVAPHAQQRRQPRRLAERLLGRLERASRLQRQALGVHSEATHPDPDALRRHAGVRRRRGFVKVDLQPPPAQRQARVARRVRVSQLARRRHDPYVRKRQADGAARAAERGGRHGTRPCRGGVGGSGGVRLEHRHRPRSRPLLGREEVGLQLGCAAVPLRRGARGVQQESAAYAHSQDRRQPAGGGSGGGHGGLPLAAAAPEQGGERGQRDVQSELVKVSVGQPGREEQTEPVCVCRRERRGWRQSHSRQSNREAAAGRESHEGVRALDRRPEQSWHQPGRDQQPERSGGSRRSGQGGKEPPGWRRRGRGRRSGSGRVARHGLERAMQAA